MVIDGRVLITTYSVRHDRQQGGAIHGRVFVTTVYNATCSEEAGLLMGVSLLSPTVYDTTGNKGRGYPWACLCEGAGLFIGVSLLLQCTTRQATGGGASHGRVFVATVYDATC